MTWESCHQLKCDGQRKVYVLIFLSKTHPTVTSQAKNVVGWCTHMCTNDKITRTYTGSPSQDDPPFLSENQSTRNCRAPSQTHDPRITHLGNPPSTVKCAPPGTHPVGGFTISIRSAPISSKLCLIISVTVADVIALRQKHFRFGGFLLVSGSLGSATRASESWWWPYKCDLCVTGRARCPPTSFFLAAL